MLKTTKAKSKRVYKKRASKPIRKTRSTSQFATCVEVIPSQGLNVNTPYIFSKAGITGGRASSMAQIYGFYRIKKIIYTHRPLYDTYAAAAGGVASYATQIPSLYWQMNRYGDAPAAFDANYMRSLGSKPNRLDDKNVVFSYSPNMLLVGEDNAGNNASQIKMTPWISTDTRPGDNTFTISTAEHFGHTLFVEAAAAGGAQGPVLNMDVKVIYEFKTPRVPQSANVDLSLLPQTVRLEL